MTTWIALLRGVNVGGITIRSADLRELFADTLGFTGVRTVLASGNVRFDSDTGESDRLGLKTDIEAALAERFGYDAWIVLVTHDELLRAIEGFPFDAADDGRQPWVVFASEETALTALAAAADGDHDADPVRLGAGVLYWNPAKGTTTDTPFGKELAKAKYRRTTTNRNLRTLVKLAD